MKLCRTCGAPMEDEATFCPMCGTENEKNIASQETTVLNSTGKETTVLNPNDVPVYVNIPRQPEPAKQKKKLSRGAIIAIVIACVLAIIAVVTVVGVIAENNKQRNLDAALDDIEIPEIDQDILDYSNPFSEYSSVVGTSTGDIYVNEYADINFHTPSSDWKMMSNDEIYEHYRNSGANVEFDDLTGKTYLSDGSHKCYYDMFMYNERTNQNIQTMIADYGADGSSVTLGQYFDYMEEGLKETYGNISLESTGIATIGRNTYSVKSVHYTASDKKLVQYYIGSKVEDCFVMICITSTVEDDKGFVSVLNSISE